jgi:hypothetical protein
MFLSSLLPDPILCHFFLILSPPLPTDTSPDIQSGFFFLDALLLNIFVALQITAESVSNIINHCP